MIYLCSVTAPEILDETPEVDLALSDVYSFGM